MQLLQIGVVAIPLLFAITVHEAAHGFVASKLGDDTALMMGRVTLNPLKHIDPVGTIILPILTLYLGGIVFGWAKPVPINWNNLRNPKLDSALVAAAGPLSNLAMAIGWAIVAKVLLMTNPLLHSGTMLSIDFPSLLYASAKFGIMINCVLMILNLLPIPPLDGSRLVSSVLPTKISKYYDSIGFFGIWILLALLVTGILQQFLMPSIQYFLNFFSILFKLQ